MRRPRHRRHPSLHIPGLPITDPAQAAEARQPPTKVAQPTPILLSLTPAASTPDPDAASAAGIPQRYCDVGTTVVLAADAHAAEHGTAGPASVAGDRTIARRAERPGAGRAGCAARG
jgi:hypothetical protein